MDQTRDINFMTVRTVANGIEVALSQGGRPGYVVDDKDVYVFETVEKFTAWCSGQKWDFAGKAER